MYAPHSFAAVAHGRAPSAQMYSRVGVETGVQGASPHKLVAMLFDGYFESLMRAKAAMAAGQIEVKGREIGRAVRIVEEGLKASLNLSAGGALAADLSDLYAYVTLRLTQANLKNDAAALDECSALVKPLHDAWQSIASQVDGPSSAQR
jgi:flagellar secretion chaperone FliS